MCALEPWTTSRGKTLQTQKKKKSKSHSHKMKFQSQIRNYKKLMSCNKYLRNEFGEFFQKNHNHVELSQAFFSFTKWQNFVLKKC
jgi:hypothetical protein